MIEAKQISISWAVLETFYWKSFSHLSQHTPHLTTFLILAFGFALGFDLALLRHRFKVIVIILLTLIPYQGCPRLPVPSRSLPRNRRLLDLSNALPSPPSSPCSSASAFAAANLSFFPFAVSTVHSCEDN